MIPTEFIALLAAPAQATQAATGIPASFTIAQGAVESAWYSSGQAVQDFNLFGIKADAGWRGVTQMPVLDLDTDQPIPGQFFPAQQSMLWKLCKWLEVCFDMDWHAFDPDDPIAFVDSINNMLPLHAKFHIHKNHGIHLAPFPEWNLQALPKKAGFVLMPDEVAA